MVVYMYLRKIYILANNENGLKITLQNQDSMLGHNFCLIEFRSAMWSAGVTTASLFLTDAILLKCTFKINVGYRCHLYN
jgi:hypothetical protein